ncbi:MULTISPECIES: hypothetical protein [Vibrio harveyi group]|uniref:Uncharacterized protein n=1 Tax=Vibrio parahaemolyticus TaxID=670 RepID=A0AA47JN12_VIBPH|nr:MULTISPECIES: hypothetical protein [Vibrio harveyi group]WAT93860.1 hypothetical protein O1Q84_27130 [Vibrio parahaemolyticus]HBC3421930.1 hypothetical protein [Vibrio parahaemolyticus]HBC3883732.1 hypothetical protein [Vibrio parahaemolyticus]HBC3907996.1 hypothetical protein [Vibrio parahaemolyticus]
MDTIEKLGVLEYSKRLMEYSLEAKITPLNVLFGNPLTKLEKMSKLVGDYLENQSTNDRYSWGDEDKARSNLFVSQTRIIELHIHTNNFILSAACIVIYCMPLFIFSM